MLLEDFYRCEDGVIRFTREQASTFAKSIAGDYNPIHDVDAKRFCVPGDLLFSVMLNQYGLSQTMTAAFVGMVTDCSVVDATVDASTICLTSDEKPCVEATRDGSITTNSKRIHQFVKAYVAYSGESFPTLLVPLMREAGKMINPQRPMVMYTDMHVELDTLDYQSLSIVPSDSTFDVQGKRGNVTLGFEFRDGDRKVGCGFKRMVLSGLREFDESAMTEVIANYDEKRKKAA